jgi:hypothetical protein
VFLVSNKLGHFKALLTSRWPVGQSVGKLSQFLACSVCLARMHAEIEAVRPGSTMIVAMQHECMTEAMPLTGCT